MDTLGIFVFPFQAGSVMSLSETSSCLAERLEENESRVSIAFVRLQVIVVFSS